MSLLPAAHLARRLTKPRPIKGGGVLRTVGEAADYVLTLDEAEHCNRWRRGAQILLDKADVAAVSRQVHLALSHDARLDIGAMDA
jgi:hypothetical protein